MREARRLAKIQAWARVTASGEIAEVPGIPEDAPVWGRVTSNADNCLGQDCPEFQRCHVVRARREAMKADVVVVNHHLLLADLALKEEGFGELLPGVDAVVVDEAHQLPEIAARFFGVSVGTRQALGLVADARAEALKAGAWQPPSKRRERRWSAPRATAAVLAGSGAGGRSVLAGAAGRTRMRRSRSSNPPRARLAAAARRSAARAPGSTRSSGAPGSPRAPRPSARAARASSCAGPRPAGAAPASTPRPSTPGARSPRT
jgi:Rad3-related DNA helicase